MGMQFFGGDDTWPIWEHLFWYSILAGGYDNPLIYILEMQTLVVP